jgi:hypothetical protein
VLARRFDRLRPSTDRALFLDRLISSLVVIPLFKFKIPRVYAYYLVVVYCGYMLFSGLVVGGVLHILA